MAVQSCEPHNPMDTNTTQAGLPEGAAARKRIPMFRGCMNFFPLALAAVSVRSQLGQDQHNPDGEDFVWLRDKSSDHLDCIARHMVDGEWDAMAWRALAHLQLAMESGWRPSNWPVEHDADEEALAFEAAQAEEGEGLTLQKIREFRDKLLADHPGASGVILGPQGVTAEQLMASLQKRDPAIDYFDNPELNRILWEKQEGAALDVDPEDDAECRDDNPDLWQACRERTTVVACEWVEGKSCYLLAVTGVIPFRNVEETVIIRVPSDMVHFSETGDCAGCPGCIAKDSVATHMTLATIDHYGEVCDAYRSLLNECAPDGFEPFHGKVVATPFENVSLTIPSDQQTYGIQDYAKWADRIGATTQLTEDRLALKFSLPVGDLAQILLKQEEAERARRVKATADAELEAAKANLNGKGGL